MRQVRSELAPTHDGKRNAPIRKLGIGLAVLLVLLLLAFGAMSLWKPRMVGRILAPAAKLDTPASLATWPWPRAVQDHPYPGVTHWLDTSSPDRTVLDLFRFDFRANPHLRLEMFDQDEDDGRPYDNKAQYWPRGVGQITRLLNTTGRGSVVAAWNGLFFDFDGIGPGHTASHLTPVVLNGKLFYPNAGNYRWTFGVRYVKGKPVFKTLFLPRSEALAGAFDFAAGAAQCLIRDGKPLKLEPFPRPGQPQRPRPVMATPQEAGYIPTVDFIRTSRTSLGWSRDNRYLYLLFVKQPGSETESAIAFRHGLPSSGGWMLSDLQRFWLALNVWGAINGDGGEPAQLCYRRADGSYLLVPPHWAAANRRLIFSPDFPNAPQGGTLMVFYVRDAHGSP
ncbi:MAG TPA: phosphodiester glycosidase family protein [Chthonomonadaceae bacterium]|nr:phosphodiester glycosidase family protein [Chthonomonadaceae bacterium]